MNDMVFVPGDVKSFTGWLRYETGYYDSEGWPRRFLVGVGWVQLLSSHPGNDAHLLDLEKDYEASEDGVQTLRQDAHVFDLSEDRGLYHLRAALMTRIVPMAEGSRVEVKWRHPAIEDYWQELRSKIAAVWGLEEMNPDGTIRRTLSPPRHQGGRPSYTEDMWALVEVRLHNREPREIYYQWLKLVEQLHPERLRQRTAPDKLFEKAISKRVQ